MSQWRPIKKLPKDGRMVLFYTPGKKWYDMNRADDYWNDAYWLKDATKWVEIPKPKEKP